MKAEIKWFQYYSTMSATFSPANPGCFKELVIINVGIQNQEGGDYFYFHITTPEWISQSFENEGKFSLEIGRHQLIVPYWNQELIEARIKAIVNEYAVGKEWKDIAEKLNRYFRWQFEDYIPYSTQ